MTVEPRPPALGTTLSALTEDDLGSPAQRDRRRRILDATIGAGLQGRVRRGTDASRRGARRRGPWHPVPVLPFEDPSAGHRADREFGRAQEKLERSPIPGDTQAERVLWVLTATTRSLQRDPQLTEAMTRAFMFADTSVAAEVVEVGGLLERMLTTAMWVDEPSEEDKAIARVIGDVWCPTWWPG